MEYLPMLFQSEFNKFITDAVNVDITNPPYYPGRVPQTFYMTSRGGFAQEEKPFTMPLSSSHTFVEILDMKIFGDYKHYLVKTLFNGVYYTKVYKVYIPNGSVNDDGTDFVTYDSSVNYKFATLPSVYNQVPIVPYMGYLYGDDSVAGVYKIKSSESGVSWTENAYAGKYLYLSTYNTTTATGVGQILRIQSNTATELIVDTWMIKPTGCRGGIYNNYGECIAVLDGEGVKVYNDSYTLIKSAVNVKDFAVYKNRIFIVNKTNNMFYSEQSYFNHFFMNSSIGNIGDIQGIVPHQDFLLLFKKDSIYIINEKTITVSNNIVYLYAPTLLTSAFGIFSKDAYYVYNQGLYIFNSNNKFRLINITPSGTDRYTISEEDSGIYIQKFLDGIVASDRVDITIYQDKVMFLHRTSLNTNIYIFDMYYKGWYRWKTSLKINSLYTYGNFYFVGDNVYVINKNNNKDYGDVTYDKSIKLILGEENAFAIKKYLFFKFLVGQKTDIGCNALFTGMLGGVKYQYSIPFSGSKWLHDVAAIQTNGTMGSSVLGFGLSGGYSSEDLTDILYASVANIEFPAGFEAELGILELIAEGEDNFMLGGVDIGYDMYEGQITPLTNVLIGN